MTEQGKAESGLQRLTAALSHSAEYSIALGLIVVCLIVGGALLLLDNDQKPAEATSEVTTAAVGQDAALAEAEEKAALEGWNKQLQGDFKQIEQQQRRAEDEAAARERQRQEADRAERAAAAAEQERQRAREAAAASERKRPEPAPVPRAAPAPVPVRQVVRVEPAIDWSSCRRPEYPSFSVTRKEEGVVTVALDLDASGKVLDSRVAESSGHRLLDTAAQRAIARCRFSPARVDGDAQAATAQVRFAWKLQ